MRTGVELSRDKCLSVLWGSLRRIQIAHIRRRASSFCLREKINGKSWNRTSPGSHNVGSFHNVLGHGVSGDNALIVGYRGETNTKNHTFALMH